jgi:phosphatidylglycerophosphate synthase
LIQKDYSADDFGRGGCMAKGTAEARRPLASRSSGWAQYLARRLTASRVTPNQISLLSIAWALLGGALLWWSPRWPAFIACAVCVQLRLLCNLLDGMVAIEGGKSTATGALFNESLTAWPTRCFWCRSATLRAIRCSAGWWRCLPSSRPMSGSWAGGALGQPQDFGGLLPKQRRMAVLTLALLVQAMEDALWGSRVSLLAAAIIITIGSLATCISRTIAIARRLEAASCTPGEAL